MQIKEQVDVYTPCVNANHWQDLIVWGKCKDCTNSHWCRKCGDEIKNEEGLCGNCAK